MTPAERKAHFARVSAMPCIVSGMFRVELHHACGGSIAELGFSKGLSLKVSDYLVLPLHRDYHTGPFGIHQLGVDTFESMYGPQADMIRRLGEKLGMDLIELARSDSRTRVRHRGLSKILPRALA